MNEKQQKPTIAIFGLGYVGCVTAGCFAELGFRVVGVDVDARKVRAILDGHSPFYEPGLEPLIAKHLGRGSLTATLSTEEALRDADYAFLCVGTPSAPNGNLNLDYLRKVATDIGSHLQGRAKPLTVVVRSTVFPGTCDEVVAPAVEPRASVVANPEFLREGSAVKDFMEPSLVVVGSHDRDAAERVAALYCGLPVRTSVVALRTAELIKYTCNTFHALKIAFANEIGTLSAALGLDGAEVMETICRDTKLNISPVYLKPGFAFGGSCLPKDVRALNYRAKELDLDLPLFQSILPSNEAHLDRAIEIVLETGKKNVAMLGLSFKAATDDLRESPQVQLVKRLIGEGRHLQIWDDNVSLGRLMGSNRQYIEDVIPHLGSLLSSDLEQVLAKAQVVIIGTRGIDRKTLDAHLRPEHVVVDLVNLEKSRRPAAKGSYQGLCW